MLEAGIENMKLHALLCGAPLRPAEADASINTMPAAMIEAAMMMALRFILNRHRSLFVLYGLSWAVPVCAAASRPKAHAQPPETDIKRDNQPATEWRVRKQPL